MALFSVADIVAAIFLLIAVIGAVVRRDERESSRALVAAMVASMVMVLLDATSGLHFPSSTPEIMLYIAVTFSVIATKCILMFFYHYCYKYFCERTDVNKWLFIVPMALLALTIVAQIVLVFTTDQVTLDNGSIVVVVDMLPIIKIASIALPLYLPILAIIKRKEVGSNAVFFAGAPAIFGILVSLVGLHDFGTLCGAAVVFFTYVLFQNGIFYKQAQEQQVLEESNADLEALNSELEERQAQLEEATAEQEAQIEEITALNSELESARHEADAANEAKTSFLFNMSHDIRTPMNAIVGFTELLRKHQDDPERREDYLTKIDGASKSLLSIINNVLDMARIESGEERLDETVCPTGVVTHEMIAIFEDQIREKNIALTANVDIQTPYMLCDQPKLREICLNILSNAVKYTPEGGSISIQMLELPCERPGYARIRGVCADTGIGMSQEFLPHLFEEFAREQTATESRQQGTGLGMPIVKKLVELMGGTIEVESELGRGTTFAVTIDLKIADVAQEAKPQGGDVEVQADFSGKRILLAEDNDLNAEIAFEILTEAGFEVERAADGVICVDMLQKAERGYYDLILMDIQMPNMDGYKATRTIRAIADEAKASIPILAMTANAFEEDKREALRNGMDGHIAKPIDVGELMSTLASVLG